MPGAHLQLLPAGLIEFQQRQGAAVADLRGHLTDGMLQRRLQVTAGVPQLLGQLRQRLHAAGVLAQRVLRRAPAGVVADGEQEFSALQVDAFGVDQQAAPLAAAVDDLVLDVFELACGDQTLRVDHLRPEELVHAAHGSDLLFGAVENRLHVRPDVREAQGFIGQEDGVRHAGQDAAVQGVGLFERLFGPDALGDLVLQRFVGLLQLAGALLHPLFQGLVEVEQDLLDLLAVGDLPPQGGLQLFERGDVVVHHHAGQDLAVRPGDRSGVGQQHPGSTVGMLVVDLLFADGLPGVDDALQGPVFAVQELAVGLQAGFHLLAQDRPAGVEIGAPDGRGHLVAQHHAAPGGVGDDHAGGHLVQHGLEEGVLGFQLARQALALADLRGNDHHPVFIRPEVELQPLLAGLVKLFHLTRAALFHGFFERAAQLRAQPGEHLPEGPAAQLLHALPAQRSRPAVGEDHVPALIQAPESLRQALQQAGDAALVFLAHKGQLDMRLHAGHQLAR